MAGRPSKLTPELQRRLVKGVRIGLTYRLAAGYAGIHSATFKRWMAIGREAQSGKYRALYAAIKEAEARGAQANMDAIARAAREGSWQAGAWIMERRHGFTVARGEERANGEDADDSAEDEVEETHDQDALIDELAGLPPELLAAALARSRE
jgi:hypothetical protein